jgi:hypothetical protein
MPHPFAPKQGTDAAFFACGCKLPATKAFPEKEGTKGRRGYHRGFAVRSPHGCFCAERETQCRKKAFSQAHRSVDSHKTYQQDDEYN